MSFVENFQSVSFVATLAVEKYTRNAKIFIPKFVSGDSEQKKIFGRGVGGGGHNDTLSID